MALPAGTETQPAGDDAQKARAWRDLGAYFALTFAITWGLGAALLFARPWLEGVVGPLEPINHSWLYFAAVYAPTIAAVTVSLAFGGLAGLRDLASGLIRPVRMLWIALAIFTYPALLLVWGLAERALGLGAPLIDLHALLIGAPVMAVTTTVLLIDPGGFGEETGWRGFALPRLLRLTRPASAGLILGAIWALWHIPAFFVSGLSQSTFNFTWFFIGVVALSVFMTWIYVNANGNFLVAGVIPHLVSNLGFDAHAVASGALWLESTVLSALALFLFAAFGPSLRGWRRLY